MLQKQVRFLRSLVAVLDLLILITSFGVAVTVRFNLSFWPHTGVPPLSDTLLQGGIALLIIPLVLRQQGLYRSAALMPGYRSSFRLLKAILLGMLLFIAVTYIIREVRYTRGGLALFAFFSYFGLWLGRKTFIRWYQKSSNKDRLRQRAIVVGAGVLGRHLVEELAHRGDIGIELVGLLTRHKEKLGDEISGVAVLGTFDQLLEVVQEEEIQQVFFALPLDMSNKLPDMLNLLLRTEPVDVHVVPDLAQWIVLGGGVYSLGSLPVVSLQDSPIGGWEALAKRLFDLAFGTPCLMLAFPIIVMFALLVKLTSRGPIFYGQERMGLDGRSFQMWKLRSMTVSAEASTGAVWAKPGDARTTAVGGLMRKFSIDELPQLWNVVAGDMSLVGPRPERPVFIERFKKEIPNYNLRHKVKAGVTGLAQVEGWRGDTSLEKRIERDLWYIENWSVWLDLKILLRTIFGGFLSKNAY
ncbi:MAG: undecaprenyl-phosphate glucose phosphotransferase [Myxococcales bacterium]|nr:undecaprenyl-phosphate glucose phosphotransferase [Myxococcales bacterium]